MIKGKKVDCLSHVICLMSKDGSYIKAIRKASTHLTEEPFILLKVAMWVREKLALGVLISRSIFPKRETLLVKLVIFRLTTNI